MNLSFAGCGFLGIYHAGVVAAIGEYAPQLKLNEMSAASAGAIAAASLMCNVDVSDSTSTFLKIVKEARSRALGALHPAFNLIDEVEKSLDLTLPDNAHEICSGRLHISLTRERDHANVVVSEFTSKAELIKAICCSCFIPYYCGRKFPAFRGVRYFDGGWTDNLPIRNENTVTVSPFSGESDICPPDLDSANLFGITFAGTSIRFTSKNLHRLTVCLMPPSMDVCCRICRQGFEDALRFCIRNNLISDARCLTILSNANICPSELPPLIRSRNASQIIKSGSGSELFKLDKANSMKEGTISSRVSIQIASLFPEVLRKVIEEAYIDNTFLGYINSFRIVRWFRTATVPFTLPFEIFYLFCKNVTKWLEDSDLDWWFAEKLRTVVCFLLKEIEYQRAMYSARLTCQLAITEVDMTTFNSCVCSSDDIELNVKPSAEAEKEFAMLRQRDSQIFERQLNKEVRKASATEAKPLRSEDVSMMNVASSYAKDHEPLLSYSYVNDNNEVRVCEIFDFDRCKKQLRRDSYSTESALRGFEQCKFQIEEFDDSTDQSQSSSRRDSVIVVEKQ